MKMIKLWKSYFVDVNRCFHKKQLSGCNIELHRTSRSRAKADWSTHVIARPSVLISWYLIYESAYISTQNLPFHSQFQSGSNCAKHILDIGSWRNIFSYFKLDNFPSRSTKISISCIFKKCEKVRWFLTCCKISLPNSTNCLN